MSSETEIRPFHVEISDEKRPIRDRDRGDAGSAMR